MNFNSRSEFLKYFRGFEFPDFITSNEEKTRFIAQWVIKNSVCEIVSLGDETWIRAVCGKVIVGEGASVKSLEKLSVVTFKVLINAVCTISDAIFNAEKDEEVLYAGSHCFSDLNF